MANPYHELLRTPDAMGSVIVSSIARLPQAMIGIGIITMLVQQSGLYWLAGTVAGTFSLANALIGLRTLRAAIATHVEPIIAN